MIVQSLYFHDISKFNTCLFVIEQNCMSYLLGLTVILKKNAKTQKVTAYTVRNIGRKTKPKLQRIFKISQMRFCGKLTTKE